MQSKSQKALSALLVGAALSSCAQPPSPEGIVTATGRECLAGDLTKFGNPRREGPLTIVVETPAYETETRFVGTVTQTLTVEEYVKLHPQDGRLSEWWIGEHYTTATHTVLDEQTGAQVTETSEENYVDPNKRFCVDSKGRVYELNVGPIFGSQRGRERG
jgi:hypothetical protein